MATGKLLHIIFLSTLLFADAVFLGLNTEQIICALVSTLAGSFILTYFRKGVSRTDRIIKIIASALGGLFIGTAIITYFNVEKIQFQGAMWFLTSFVVLILLRALLSATDSNAKGIITTILRSFIKVDGQLLEKKTKVITKPIDPKEIVDLHEAQVVSETKLKEIDLDKEG